MGWPSGRSLRAAIAILALAAGIPAGEEGDPARFVVGQVLDANGKPVPGARVEAQADLDVREWTSLAEATSDPEGKYRLGPLPAFPSVLSVRASRKGYASSRRQGFPGAHLTFRLEPPGILRGRALRDATGEPVGGFLLELEQDPGSWCERAITGPDGAFEVRDLPAGRYYLGSRRGPEVLLQGVEVRAGRATLRDVWIPRGTTILGRVVDTDGSPVPGARVGNWSRETTTASDGSYRVEGMGPATESRSYVPWPMDFEAMGRRRLVAEAILPLGLREFRIDAVLEPDPGPSRIRGRALREGRPVPGARVSLDPGSLFLRPAPGLVAADEGGAFELQGPFPEGTFRVHARTDDGLLGISPPVQPGAGEGEPVVLEMVPSALLLGTVGTAEGPPAIGRTVSVRSAGAWTGEREAGQLSYVETDDDGRFALRAPPGAILLDARQGRKPYELALAAVPPGATVEGIAFGGEGAATTEASRLTGVVVDGAGRPIEGVALTSFGHLATTDSEGRFLVEGAWAEIHPLLFDHPDYASKALFHVRPGRGPLRIVLQRGLEIRGRVVPSQGVPPARSFRVEARHPVEDSSRGKWTEHNDGEGRFVLRNLEPGIYSLRVKAEAGVSARVGGIRVAPGEPAPDVRIPLGKEGRIAGTVRDPSGKARPFVTVWGSDPMDRHEASDSVIRGPVATTDSTGRFVWPCLAEGEHAVEVPESEEFHAVSRTVAVVAGKETACDLVLCRGGNVRVKVVDGAGKPVAGAWVRFYTVSGNEIEAERKRVARIRKVRGLPARDDGGAFDQDETGEDGILVREALPPGPCVVRVYAARADAPRLDGTARLEVREGGTVEVRVKVAPE